MAARMTNAEKVLKARVDAAFRAHNPGNPINIFDIAKVTAAGTAAGLAGGDVDAAVKAAFLKYRQSV